MRTITTGMYASLKVFFVGLLLIGSAKALEPLSTSALSNACAQLLADNNNVDASVCSAYIRGYVEASSKVRIAADNKLSFTERAMVSRAPDGSHKIDTLRNAQYCVPPDTDIYALASHVVDKASTFKADSAFKLLGAVLKDWYPC